MRMKKTGSFCVLDDLKGHAIFRGAARVEILSERES
jgi:hypothetical protein